jgi:hypothetical protein
MPVIIKPRIEEAQSNRPNRSGHKVVRREIKVQPGRHLEPGSRDARLQDIEDRLLAKMIATHGNRERALDRLLHDVLEPTHQPSTPRALPLQGDRCVSKRLHQIEDLLLAAVIENHPNAERAMDRLCEDLDESDAGAPLAPAAWDNDWDGMS